jgi:hypothetical protein
MIRRMTDIFDKLINELTLEVIFECHRASRSKTRNEKLLLKVNQRSINTQNMANELYECFNCKRKFPCQRYAVHLEKCLMQQQRSRRRFDFSAKSNSQPNPHGQNDSNFANTDYYEDDDDDDFEGFNIKFYSNLSSFIIQ